VIGSLGREFEMGVALPFGAASAALSTASSKVVVRVGSLEVIEPFLPNRATSSVAAIYLTVKNTGSQADALISASSPISSDSMLMGENGQDSSMEMLAELRIPAHGRASLKPEHDHVMREEPKMNFKVGRTVLVTLHIERSGSVTLEVPVGPLSRIIGN